MPNAPSPNGEWYQDGLRFSCTQCGDCCTGAPGFVYVNDDEIAKIAAFLGKSDSGLTRAHIRPVGRQFSLTEDKKTGDCCFLVTSPKGKRTCSIYPVRPLQCRTWPFWTSNLEDRHAWQDAAGACPGMNKGKHYDFVQIEIRRTADTWEDLPS